MYDKIIINYLTGIFICICILIVLLLNIYYLSPNNYELIILDSNKYNIIDKQYITIKANDKFTFDQNNPIKSNYLQFNSDCNLIISNFFKSQNIMIEKTNILKIKFNSDLTILNNSNSEIKIKINFISLI